MDYTGAELKNDLEFRGRGVALRCHIEKFYPGSINRWSRVRRLTIDRKSNACEVNHQEEILAAEYYARRMFGDGYILKK